MLTCFPNPRHGTPGLVTLNAAGFRRARAEITAWPGYAPTPLHALPTLAAEAGVATIHLKDESPRFGLGSFKALGGAYAVLGALQAELSRRGTPNPTAAALESQDQGQSALTVCCATDGNHGRSVAWGARRFGARCTIFVHEGVSQARVAAIAGYGATIRTVPGTYDDAVHEAAATANREGWLLVADTSHPGYTEVPRAIMQGYRLMPDEALDQMPGPPTHVLIQAGVGGAAAAVAVQMRARLHPAPVVAVVEPEGAACLLLSARAGAPTPVHGSLDTIMAGLACGEPSLLAWQELDRSADAFLSIPDPAAINAMRRLHPLGITAGESGAAGLAALLLAANDPAARATLRLTENSHVLLFNTEGDTDPALYRQLVQ